MSAEYPAVRGCKKNTAIKPVSPFALLPATKYYTPHQLKDTNPSGLSSSIRSLSSTRPHIHAHQIIGERPDRSLQTSNFKLHHRLSTCTSLDQRHRMASPGKPAAPWVVKLTHDAVEQGLPTDKIRRKLVLEGAEPDEIDLVLAHGLESPIYQIEPSPPCTSPQRRQLSAR